MLATIKVFILDFSLNSSSKNPKTFTFIKKLENSYYVSENKYGH